MTRSEVQLRRLQGRHRGATGTKRHGELAPQDSGLIATVASVAVSYGSLPAASGLENIYISGPPTGVFEGLPALGLRPTEDTVGRGGAPWEPRFLPRSVPRVPPRSAPNL